jgi:hypothetical protein
VPSDAGFTHGLRRGVHELLGLCWLLEGGAEQRPNTGYAKEEPPRHPWRRWSPRIKPPRHRFGRHNTGSCVLRGCSPSFCGESRQKRATRPVSGTLSRMSNEQLAFAARERFSPSTNDSTRASCECAGVRVGGSLSASAGAATCRAAPYGHTGGVSRKALTSRTPSVDLSRVGISTSIRPLALVPSGARPLRLTRVPGHCLTALHLGQQAAESICDEKR